MSTELQPVSHAEEKGPGLADAVDAMQLNPVCEKKNCDMITNLVHIWATKQEPSYTACGLLDHTDTCQGPRLVAEGPGVPVMIVSQTSSGSQ